jgi:hypothetical protein
MGKEDARARITVKVQPRARATRIAGRIQNAYRLQVAAPPVDGKANDACIAVFAEVAGVAKRRAGMIEVIATVHMTESEVARDLYAVLPSCSRVSRLLLSAHRDKGKRAGC